MTTWRREPFCRFQLPLKAADRTRVLPGYLDRDKDGTPPGLTLTETQRGKVVEYIADVAQEFGLSATATLFAVNYFDRWYTHVCLDKHAKQDRIDRSWKLHVSVVTRMLTARMVNPDCASHVVSLLLKPGPSSAEVQERVQATRRTLELASCVCVLMAAKFEDVQCPSLPQLVEVCAKSNTSTTELRRLELEMLGVLNWNLNVKNPYSYIDDLATFCDYRLEGAIKNRVELFMDLSSHSYDLLKFHPAVIAAGSLLVTWRRSDNEIPNADKFMHTLSSACNVSPSQLREAADLMDGNYSDLVALGRPLVNA